MVEDNVAVLVSDQVGRETVTARYPSARFPGPPGVSVDVPVTWSPLAAEAYLRFGGQVDLAVVGPAEVDGVRPSLVVGVSRTAPTDEPRSLLEAVAATFGAAARLESAGSFAPASAAVGHLSHAVGYDEPDGDRLVRRHRLTAYVHGEVMGHVVSVVGSAAATDTTGRAEVVAMLRSLRIVAPWAPRAGSGVAADE